MAKASQILCAKIECSLFNQITLFCIGGLSMSTALIVAYGIRIESWM